MRSKQRYILVGILVIFALIFLVTGNKKSSIRKSHTKFSFNKSENASEIQISQYGKTIVLSNSTNGWLINGSPVNKKKLDVFLGALKNLKMQSTVSSNETKQLEERALNKGITIIIKENNRTTYNLSIIRHNKKPVGLLPKSKPYYIYINGYPHVDISDLVSTKTSFWRENILFGFSHEQIALVEMEYPQAPETSFSIINTPDGAKLFDNNKNPVAKYYPENVNDYLHFFTEISFREKDLITHKFDTSSIMFRLNLLSKQKEEIKLKSFALLNNNTNAADKLIFAGIINETDTVFLKYSDFYALLTDIDYFLKK